MATDTQSIWTMAVTAIAVVVWLVRLEGRVNQSEARLVDMNEKLKYIVDRIDRALNGHDR
jgi:hypothetical protein